MKIYIIIFMLFLITVINAFNFTDHTVYNEDNTCAVENNGFYINIYPCKVQDVDGKDITQYIDYTWNNTDTVALEYMFLYENNLTSGDFYYWNESIYNKSFNGSETVNNVLTFTETNETIEYGDLYTPVYTYEFNISYYDMLLKETINMSEVWGYDSYYQIDNSTYSLNWDYSKEVNESSWIKVENSPEYIGNYNLTGDSMEYYNAFSKQFISNETLKTKWVYTPSELSPEGKWFILGKYFNETIYEALSTEKYVYSDPWYDSNWIYKKEITIRNNNINSYLSNFPLLVVLNTSNFDYAHAKTNGEDIRFIDSTETTELDYEIESWNNTGASYIHVKIPDVYTLSNTTFYIYYGNSEAEDGQDVANVWSNSFGAVWHIDEASTGTRYDSTGNSLHNCITYNYDNDEKTIGIINGADDMDNTNDYLNCSSNTNITKTPPYTVEIWTKTHTSIESVDPIINKYTGGSWSGFFLYRNSGGNLCSWHLASGMPGGYTAIAGDDGVGDIDCPPINSNTWYHITITVNSSGMFMYLNGSYITEGNWFQGSMANSSENTPFTIGTYGPPLIYYNGGTVDETRLSSVARSPAWIKASYHSGINNITTFGMEETNIDTDPVIVFNSPLHTSWIINNWVILNYSAIDGNNEDINTTLYGDENIASPTTVLMQNNSLNGSVNNSILFNWTDLNETTYYHYLYAIDNTSHFVSSPIYEFYVDLTDPYISFINQTTETGAYAQNWINFNITFSDTNINLAHIYLYHENGTVLYNITLLGFSSPYYFNATNLSDGTYYLNASAEDIAGRINQTETRNITLCNVPPEINITFISKGITWLKWNWTVDSGEIINITLYETNTSNIWESLTNMSLTEYTFSNLYENTEYTLKIYAKDILNNTGSAEDNQTTAISSANSGIGGTGVSSHNSLLFMIFFIMCVIVMVYLFNRGK